MDPDFLIVDKLARATRSVARAALAVKIICGVAYFIAACLFLYGLSRIDRGDDIIFYSVFALGISAIATLFWSIVSFHAASAHGMALLASLHGKLDVLLGAMAAGAQQANEAAAAKRAVRRPRAEDGPPLEPAATRDPALAEATRGELAPGDAREVSGVMPSPALASGAGGAAGAVAGRSFSLDTTEVAPAPTAPAAVGVLPGADRDDTDDDGSEKRAKQAPRPQPTDGVETKSCRTCGSEIRADATRCRWCMKAA